MASDHWSKTTLGEICADERSILTGPFGSQLHARDYVAAGVPVIMPRDLSGGRISTERISRVRAEKAIELARYRVKAGDVLLARRGEMGRCARVSKAAAGWLCGTGCLQIRCNGFLSSRFLAHYLRCPVTVAWLRDHAVGQTLPGLNTGIVTRIPFRLPPLVEQQRIASVLDSLDLALAAAEKVLARTRSLREDLLRRLLTKGPGTGFREQQKLRLSPPEWECLPVGRVCSLTSGRAFRTSDRSEDGLPIIRIRNLNGSREFHRYRGGGAPGCTVESGDLVFAWAGLKGSSFGPRLWRGPRGLLNQHIFRVTPGAGVEKEWLFEALKLATHKIEERAQGFKSNLLHLRKADLLEHHIPVPPLRVQRWIAARSRSLAAGETTERSTVDRIAKLRRGLALNLLSGRVNTLW